MESLVDFMSLERDSVKSLLYINDIFILVFYLFILIKFGFYINNIIRYRYFKRI